MKCNLKKFLQNKVAVVLTLILVLVVAGSGIGLWYINSIGQTGKTAQITQNGKVIKTIHLDTVTEAYTFRVDGSNGAYNIIEVRPGEIGIVEASCPDDLCVKMGFIHSVGIPVTCLPNKLVIKIVADSEDTMVPDQVTY